MNGKVHSAEVMNLTRQGVGRLLGLAPTLLRCGLLKKSATKDSTEESAPEQQTRQRHRKLSATKRPRSATDDRAPAHGKRRRKLSSATVKPLGTTETGAAGEKLKRRRRQSASNRSHGSAATVIQLGSSGCEYELVQDTSCLTKLVMACSSSSALLPEVTNQEDLLTHMQEFAIMLADFPSFLSLGGEYIGPTVLRKHLIGLLASVSIDWKAISRATLESWSVDRGNHLSTIPPSWTVAELHMELGVEPIYISMWCCLLHEVEHLGPRAAHACRFRGEELRTLLQAYKDKHGIPPCPYILVSELLAADDKLKHCRSRAEAKSTFLQTMLESSS